MLRMLGYAGHAEKPVSLFATSAGPACKVFAQHAASMPRVLDAKTFRGDVSKKFRCIAPPHDSKLSRGNEFAALSCFRRFVIGV
jgi:hypothetical protein